MRKLPLVIFALLAAALAACGGGSKPLPTEIAFVTDFNAASAEAAKEKKPMVIDFYTDWCKWCHVLDTVTYKDSIVIDMSRSIIFVKINAEVDTALARRFNVTGFPTIVVAGPDGQEIDRIMGYLPPADFYNQVQLYLQGSETLDDYLTRLQDEPDNPEYLMTIGDKYTGRGDWAKAKEFYNRVLALDTDNIRGLGTRALKAIFEAYGNSGDYKSAIETCQEIITKYPTAPETDDASAMIGYYTSRAGDLKAALELYRAYLEKYPEGRNPWVKNRVADIEEKL